MEILNYTDDHDRFRKRLRAFLEKEVIPHVDQWEEDKIVPKSVWRKMGQQGFLCMDVSPKYGGMGGDFRYSVIVAEELTKTWHTGLTAALHSDIVVPYMNSFGSEELKKKYPDKFLNARTIDWLEVIKDPEEAKAKVKQGIRDGAYLFFASSDQGILREVVKRCNNVMDEAYKEVKEEKK